MSHDDGPAHADLTDAYEAGRPALLERARRRAAAGEPLNAWERFELRSEEPEQDDADRATPGVTWEVEEAEAHEHDGGPATLDVVMHLALMEAERDVDRRLMYVRPTRLRATLIPRRPACRTARRPRERRSAAHRGGNRAGPSDDDGEPEPGDDPADPDRGAS
jgi:hypothetical protein